jgi:starch synthase
MYSQAYGTVPIVSNVGGLVDTVTDYAVSPATGTGIITVAAPTEFAAALQRALELFGQKPAYAAVQRRAMLCDFSWTKAVGAYEQLYMAAL